MMEENSTGVSDEVNTDNENMSGDRIDDGEDNELRQHRADITNLAQHPRLWKSLPRSTHKLWQQSLRGILGNYSAACARNDTARKTDALERFLFHPARTLVRRRSRANSVRAQIRRSIAAARPHAPNSPARRPGRPPPPPPPPTAPLR